MTALLEFRDTVVSFRGGSSLLSRLAGRGRSFNAVDHIDLSVKPGEILGIAGESGSGKTTICKAALELHETSGGTITQEGKPLGLHDGSLQMVFQDPLSSLNPRQTVAQALEIPLRLRHLGKGDIDSRIADLLADVGLNT